MQHKRSLECSQVDVCDDEHNMLGRSNKRTKTATNSSSPLCSHCRQLDIDSWFDHAFESFQRVKRGLLAFPQGLFKSTDGMFFYNDAIHIHSFGDRLSQPSPCPLCTFFRTLRVQPDLHERYKIIAFRSSDSWLYRGDWVREGKESQDYKDPTIMGVVPDIPTFPPNAYHEKWLDYDIPAVGAIYRLESGELPCLKEKKLLCGREVTATTDWLGEVKNCLNLCRRDHGPACCQQVSHEPISRGFRLINCTLNPPAVEDKPWGTPYAALSYVWGTTPNDLIDWPTTVLDAIEVTKSLGLEYIWVDRTCINQSDIEEKMYLISRMTTIYEAAEIAIVAAAGSGASHGLPGIRQTPRRPQPKYYLDSGSVLLSMLRDPRLDILQSPYWTRGWTYQEAMLSNKHVVFTDEQIYWECRCMATHESIDLFLFHMGTSPDPTSPSVMMDFHLSGIFKDATFSGRTESHGDEWIEVEDQEYRLQYGFPTQSEVIVRDQLRGLGEHIREYSKRNLTQDTDTLLAFQGMVGMYERTRQLYIFQGLPLWTGTVAGHAAGLHITFALSISSWYHRASSDHFMFISDSCSRKPHLPSWTWAGWKGTVTWRAPPNLEHCAYMSDLIKAERHDLLWVANLRLSNTSSHQSINLQYQRSSARLESEKPSLLEIVDPLVLTTFEREVDTEKEWKWTRSRGRPGRQQNTGETTGWDEQWIRIGRRLSITGMSIEITESEWTRRHNTGELVTVLIFAGKYLMNEHGTARFLTLRRVSMTPEIWERVGTLYLILPFLGKMWSVKGMFTRIPTRRWGRSIVVQ